MVTPIVTEIVPEWMGQAELRLAGEAEEPAERTLEDSTRPAAAAVEASSVRS